MSFYLLWTIIPLRLIMTFRFFIKFVKNIIKNEEECNTVMLKETVGDKIFYTVNVILTSSNQKRKLNIWYLRRLTIFYRVSFYFIII